MTAHPLYLAAEQADAHLTAVLTAQCEGRTPHTLIVADYAIPEVRQALTAKLDADQAWRTYLRTSRTKKG